MKPPRAREGPEELDLIQKAYLGRQFPQMALEVLHTGLLDTIDNSTGDASLTSMVSPAAFVSVRQAAVCISTLSITTIL